MAIHNFTSSFPDWAAAAKVLVAWREGGIAVAEPILSDEIKRCSSGLLLQELYLRLHREPGPRILIDGCWFSRAYGGITRVWQQIFSTCQLPGMVNPEAPVALIERKCSFTPPNSFFSLQGQEVNPFDPEAVAALSEENSRLVREWNADVFCSSWISNCGFDSPACPELALVHDCLPERIRPDQPELMALRRRWWQGAATHLAVSSDTAEDLAHLLQKPDLEVSWCHLAPAAVFRQSLNSLSIPSRWRRLQQHAGLPNRFVLLPATSAIGRLQKSRARGSGSSRSRSSFAAACALRHCCRAACPGARGGFSSPSWAYLGSRVQRF